MLSRFGFTPTESRAYSALLAMGASTGYAVARELSIARANAYQALEALARRGAIRRVSTRPVRFVAVPPVALVAELDRSFRRDLAELEDTLRALQRSAGRGGGDLELLTSSEDLAARVEDVAAAATGELLVVTGPWAQSTYEALERAERRGAQVRITALGSPAPNGSVVRTVPDSELSEHWGGLPVAAVADRTSAVLGVMTTEGASGIATELPGVVPFIRHLLRRELAGP